MQRAIAATINGEFLSRALRLEAVFFSKAALRRECRKIFDWVEQQPSPTSSSVTQVGTHQIELTVPAYQANNTQVNSMAEACRPLIDDGLASVLIQGSLGTDEVVPYSDFDAVAVLEERAFASEDTLLKTVKILHDARSILYQQDPLQHHGWFALTYHALANFPQDFLPLAVLNHARSVIQPFVRSIAARRIESTDTLKQLQALCNKIRVELDSNRHQKSLYACKSMLSKFMLLPAIYLQLREGMGFFKRDSFAIAARELPTELWVAMDTASKVREQWPETPVGFQRLKTRTDVVGAIARRRLSGPVPHDIQIALSDQWVELARALITEIEYRASGETETFV